MFGLTPEQLDSQPRESVMHEEGRQLAGEPPQQEITDRTENARFSSGAFEEIKIGHAAHFSEVENPKRSTEGEIPKVQASGVPDTPVTPMANAQSRRVDTLATERGTKP